MPRAVLNRRTNDELLQVCKTLPLSRSLIYSLGTVTPPVNDPFPIQNSFSMFHKSRIPDDVKRGGMQRALIRHWCPVPQPATQKSRVPRKKGTPVQ
jgi:hypothetical protein